MIVIHVGNRMDSDDRDQPRFDPSQLDAVTSVLERALLDVRPRAVVSAAANGADLILLTLAQRLRIPVRVVLPLPVDDFCNESVACADPRWVADFDSVLARARATPRSAVEVHDLRHDPRWYITAHRLLLDHAQSIAEPGEPITALTVRPEEGENPPSATDEFARLAAEQGLTVLTVDPRTAHESVIRGG